VSHVLKRRRVCQLHERAISSHWALRLWYNAKMHPVTDKQKWRAQYRQTSEELARLETVDLASLTDEEALVRLHRLEPVERPWRERPDWSGLVEQQAIFHRRRGNARV
jgi:hypothetical protein